MFHNISLDLTVQLVTCLLGLCVFEVESWKHVAEIIPIVHKYIAELYVYTFMTVADPSYRSLRTTHVDWMGDVVFHFF